MSKRLTWHGQMASTPTGAQLSAFYNGLIGLGLTPLGAPVVRARGAMALFEEGVVALLYRPATNRFYAELLCIGDIDLTAAENLFVASFPGVSNHTRLEDHAAL